ncbi:39S ribosomal protein L45, mitochondrial [Bufo bufo]|uniref:39S ribosomal protein L45, mitochondrial n=1 Tax=Bufo bufo TaxID=8384 RepID=UPI001ABDCDD8|nr:39S ribosomal protein L45, mitochondrial [Bufo bufo]
MAASMRVVRALGEPGLAAFLSPIRMLSPITVIPVRTKKRMFKPPSLGNKLTVEAMIKKAKAAGIVAPQEDLERPINISCTAGILDPYVPPEGDARLSTLSKDGLKQRTEQLKQTAASQLAIRKIKNYDEDFSTKTFPEEAREIFIEAHNCLTQFDRHKLHSLVTERCYPEMVQGNRYRTILWSFVESLEPPKIVQVRCPEMVTKGNLYGQVTVRMHSKQTLIVYDRFGRLECGSEEPRDVLEYLVFERHLVNPYGSWRLHGKIVPSWAPLKEPIVKTVMLSGPVLKPEQELEDVAVEKQDLAPKQWYK